MFSLHPSTALRALFASRPWQGTHPAHSTFLFVGLDANYAADIESQSIFAKIVEYHEDGIAFWRRYGVHHPFLLPGYRGDGLRYHRNFARIGFTPRHADQVSFVELLHLPTVGRSQLDGHDFDADHLAWLDELIRRGAARHIFISDGVARRMVTCGRFPWLPMRPTGSMDLLPVYWRDAERRVHQHLHFSNYGKFEQRLQSEAAAIRDLALTPANASSHALSAHRPC